MRDYYFYEAKDNKRAVFFDRDGTINVDVGYGHKKEDCKLFGDSIEALKIISDLGVYIFIVTNQSGIALKKYGVSEMSNFNRLIVESLKHYNVNINGIYYCPHYDDKYSPEGYMGCDCSKPKPGLLLEAAKDFDINLDESIIIGDQLIDIGAGISAGIKDTILVSTGIYEYNDYTHGRNFNKYKPKYVVPSLLESANIVKDIL